MFVDLSFFLYAQLGVGVWLPLVQGRPCRVGDSPSPYRTDCRWKCDSLLVSSRLSHNYYVKITPDKSIC